jgi:hypothetical protein
MPRLQSPFQRSLKVPSVWAHSRLPNWAPMKRDASPPEPLSAISQSPQYLSPLQVAQLSSHEERCLSPEPSIHNPGSPVREFSLGTLCSEPRQRETPPLVDCKQSHVFVFELNKQMQQSKQWYYRSCSGLEIVRMSLTVPTTGTKNDI